MLAGVPLKAGDRVGLSFAAANRDPEKFADPEKFDILRKPAGHLAFGAGIHRCVGQMVARMEAEVIYSELARRVASMSAAGPATKKITNALTSYSALPIRVVAR